MGISSYKPYNFHHITNSNILKPLDIILLKLRQNSDSLLRLDKIMRNIVKYNDKLINSIYRKQSRNQFFFREYITYTCIEKQLQGSIKVDTFQGSILYKKYVPSSKTKCYFCQGMFSITYHDHFYYNIRDYDDDDFHPQKTTICNTSGKCHMFMDIACILASIFDCYLSLLIGLCSRFSKAKFLNKDIINNIITISIQRCMRSCSQL